MPRIQMKTISTVLKFTKEELNLKNILPAGQAFRWSFLENSNAFVSTVKLAADKEEYAAVRLSQDENGCVKCSCLTDDSSNITAEILTNWAEKYFRVEVSLSELYKSFWLKKDARFQTHEPCGIRILAQEPWETLVSFICSSNNNISRITKMCDTLCREFGNLIFTHEDEKYYSFPTSDELLKHATEARLRDTGFGYRAKYIMETAAKIVEQKKQYNLPNDTLYLKTISNGLTNEELREHLMEYTGVGPKVADCVCLMGFQRDDIVPVDVHVGRIAKRDYSFKANKNKMNLLRERYSNFPITRKKVNIELDLIRLMFAELWGSYAGWAQGILFFQEVNKTDKKDSKIKLENSTGDNKAGIKRVAKQKPSAKKIKIES